MTKHLRFLFVTLLAWVCAVGGYAAVGDTYKLVTDVNDLKAGDVIVIAGSTYNKAMGTSVSKNKRSPVNVKIVNGSLKYVSNLDEVTLEKGSDCWYLHSTKGYLSSASTNAVYTVSTNTSADTKASISIDGNNATIMLGTVTDRYLTYGGSYFAMYLSKKISNKVQIYKKEKVGIATTLSFQNSSYTITKGNEDKFESPVATLTDASGNKLGATGVTYSCVNENNVDFATVDATTGNVTINKEAAVGSSATITASYAGDATYAAAQSVSYTLTYQAADSRAEAGFHYAETSKTLELYKGTKGSYLMEEDNFFVNTNVITGITYSSSNPEVATVTEDGDLELKSVGATTIKATFDGNDNYKPCESSFELTIVDSRAEAGISFSKNTYEADLTKGLLEGVVFNNPNSLKVSFNSDAGIVYDEVNGCVTYDKTGTYKITATAEGNENFKGDKVECEINVKDPNEVVYEETPVTFVAGKTKGNLSAAGAGADAMTIGLVTISSDRANFSGKASGKIADYRFYKASGDAKGEHTFSTKLGSIVKIEFTYSQTGSGLDKLEANTGTYNASNTKDAVWTGESKSITFTATNTACAETIVVTVKAPKEMKYTYGESDANTIEKYGNATITLNRPLVAGKWNTLCLPFDMDAAMIKDVFGDIQVAGLDENTTETGLLSFKKTTAIKAATPYLVKPTEGKDTYVFENVEVTETSPYYSVNGSQIAFVGVYNPTDITTDVKQLDTNDGDYYAAFLGSDGKLYKVEEGSTDKMKGFRAYFAIPSDLKVANVSVGGVVTSIKSIEGADADGADAPVYNLQGQRVDGKQLQRGIYVRNGRIFIVK